MKYSHSVSFVLIAYNQESFIRKACEAALSQEGEAIEIILSDDCSTDNTFQIMQEVVQSYQGCHHVRLNQTTENVGLIEHINQVVELSRGEVIIYAAGDDISNLDRVQKTMAVYRNKKPLLVHSCVQEIDIQGNILGIWRPPIFGKHYSCVEMAKKYSLIIGASCAWHRSIWQKFGKLRYPESYEDAVMALRVCMMGGVEALTYVDEPLVRYRVSASGVSQAGRNKPKNRCERQLFELKRLRSRSAICDQRLDDARLVQSSQMMGILEQEQRNNRMTQLVYEKQQGWATLFITAIKTRTLVSMAVAAVRRLSRM